MKFLDKFLGTLMGVLFIVACAAGGEGASDYILGFVGGGCFTILNLILPFDAFQSFTDWLTESDFSALLGKWVMLLLISYVLSGLVSSVFLGQWV